MAGMLIFRMAHEAVDLPALLSAGPGLSGHGRCSGLSRGSEFAEGLGGLGEGVGDGLVPVHVCAASAQLPGKATEPPCSAL
jgi:hypothetical protein